jgi:uncharacterized repeat protein (TIGR01451 family)
MIIKRARRGASPRSSLASGSRRLGLVIAAAALTITGVAARPASTVSASSAMSVSVTSNPNPVATGQAMAYTITATNTGGSDASALTMTDTITNLVPAAPQTAPFFKTSSGSCSYDSTNSQVTCTAASLPAGKEWTVGITAQMTAAAGTTLPNTATVTGTESGAQFSQSGSTTTKINPSLPAGFKQTQLAGGLKKPVVLAFPPGGDIWIGEQGGTILDYHNGAVQPTPVVTLPNVYSTGECGLLGIALDPNFSTNGYVYISYVVNVTNKSGVTQPFSRLSRFTYSGGTIDPATEKVYYQGDQAQNQHHPGNDLQIGPDGKLWWSVGDNVPAISNGEALSNIYGKMLRFNLDGTVPADNPFVNTPNAVPAIYAYGLRNPFRFTFLPNGQAMTENTGSSYWEDLDTIQRGGNYGWDYFEGNCFSCGYLNPAYAYGHYPVDGAASAIAAYSGSTFPNAYDHVVFFGDYNRHDIEAVMFDPSYQTEVSDTVFDTNAGTIADLAEGPDGNLYFVSVFEGTFSEISAPGPFPPTAKASATPNAGPTPLTVQFSSAGSSDPYGQPLGYSWDFGDGTTSTSANPSHVYSSNGTYTVKLTVTGGGGQTATSTTTVVVGPRPPTASITAPSTYNAGDTVSFSGTATDPVDGTLPGYDYTWQVDFISNGVVQPSYYAEVPYPFYGPTAGITSGSFQIPNDVSQVPGSYYRITLTVTDAAGLRTVVTKDIHPNLTNWSVTSNVPGTGYFVDGAWHTGTYSTQDVVGVKHILTGMPLAQVISGTRYRFAGWADGSALADSFTSTASPATYTANYDTVQSSMPSGWQSADIGAPITAGTADYSPSSQSFYLDGSGADEYGSNDQSHFVYQTMPGDGSIVARVRYQSNSSPWAKAGLMIRQSTATGANFVDALVTPDVSPNTPDINGVGCDANGCLAPLPPVVPPTGYGVRMQYTGPGGKTGVNLSGFTDPNKWLKLTRSGNTFTSYESTDGTHWTQIGVATVSMSGPVDVGLFDTAHNIGQVSSAAFDNVQVTQTSPPPPPGPLPSPWTDTDVGSPAIAGSASYNNGVFAVNGAGADIWGTNDQFHYVDQPLTGNGTIVARLTSMTNTSSNAKAGVIIKQSTAAGSNYMLIADSPSGTVKVQYDFSGSTTASTTYTFPNAWMKLVSLNGVITAYLSSDGVNWTNVLHKTLPITSPATIGLFECSHNTSALGTATFDNVNFTPGP